MLSTIKYKNKIFSCNRYWKSRYGIPHAKLYILYKVNPQAVWCMTFIYHLLVTCVYIRHFTIGKQPELTVITYCRGSIPLIHAILFSRLHCQLRKLYWRHVTCSDTELVTPEENRHLIFDYQSFNANIIWHLSSCIAIIRNKTMYFKQRCIKDTPQCNTVKLDYGESLGFSLSEIR